MGLLGRGQPGIPKGRYSVPLTRELGVLWPSPWALMSLHLQIYNSSLLVRTHHRAGHWRHEVLVATPGSVGSEGWWLNSLAVTTVPCRPFGSPVM